jgi:hypothetical protein
VHTVVRVFQSKTPTVRVPFEDTGEIPDASLLTDGPLAFVRIRSCCCARRLRGTSCYGSTAGSAVAAQRSGRFVPERSSGLFRLLAGGPDELDRNLVDRYGGSYRQHVEGRLYTGDECLSVGKRQSAAPGNDAERGAKRAGGRRPHPAILVGWHGNCVQQT